MNTLNGPLKRLENFSIFRNIQSGVLVLSSSGYLPEYFEMLCSCEEASSMTREDLTAHDIDTIQQLSDIEAVLYIYKAPHLFNYAMRSINEK